LAVLLGALCRRDGGRRAHGERLQQSLMLAGERAVVLVDRYQHPVCVIAKDEGNDEPALDAHTEKPEAVLLKAHTVELIGQVLRLT